MIRTGMDLYCYVGIPRAVQRRDDAFRAPGRLHALIVRTINEKDTRTREEKGSRQCYRAVGERDFALIER